MKAFMERRQLQLQEINRRVRTDAPRFMEEEDARYAGEVGRLARHLAAGLNGRRIVMLCGPTSSGKTTTALLLRDSLRRWRWMPIPCPWMIFTEGGNWPPVLEDGASITRRSEALDLTRLQTCMQEIIENGSTSLPLFDFMAGRPAAETRPPAHRAGIGRDIRRDPRAESGV